MGFLTLEARKKFDRGERTAEEKSEQLMRRGNSCEVDGIAEESEQL
jgi:hypothetical protein